MFVPYYVELSRDTEKANMKNKSGAEFFPFEWRNWNNVIELLQKHIS